MPELQVAGTTRVCLAQVYASSHATKQGHAARGCCSSMVVVVSGDDDGATSVDMATEIPWTSCRIAFGGVQ
eukprot:1793071-Pyramimonas_sp.AAC.1